MKKETICYIYYLQTAENVKDYAIPMLKSGFREMFAEDFDEKKMKRMPMGKPYYEDLPHAYFNISHCRNGIAVAVSKYPVGIDVESVRKVKFGTAKKCCADGELKYVMGEKCAECSADVVLSKQETERFLHLWTLKESYVKMTGEGLRMPADSIDFDTDTLQKNGEKDVFSKLYFPKELILALTLKGYIEEEVKQGIVLKEFLL